MAAGHGLGAGDAGGGLGAPVLGAHLLLRLKGPQDLVIGPDGGKLAVPPGGLAVECRPTRTDTIFVLFLFYFRWALRHTAPCELHGFVRLS